MYLQTGLRDYVIQAADDLDFFRKARDLGFNGVEPSPTREQLTDPSQKRLMELFQAGKETGLLVPSLSLSHHNQGGLGSRDETVRQSAIQDVRRAFEWAQKLESTTFLIPFFGIGSLQDNEARMRGMEALRVLCPEAEALGITLAFEGDLPAEEVIVMAQQLQSPAFGCYFDMANPLTYGRDPARELELLGDLVASVHIKDFQNKLGDCRPGEGRVPLEACAATLGKIGYEGWLILETPPATVELVARDLEFVKKFF